MKTVLTAFLFLTGILTSALGEAIITLKSGEVLQGDLLSDTNNVVQIRAYSHNRSISSRRDIPRSDIQNIQNETPAEAAERVSYFALSKFQLNPDQEQTTAFYNQWIAAFEKHLKDYPKSDKAAILQQRVEACRAELKHMADGEVKFGNQWMTPEEKKPKALNKQLATLISQRDLLAAKIARLQVEVTDLNTKLKILPREIQQQDHVWVTERHGYNGDGSPRLLTVDRPITKTVPNQEAVNVHNRITICNQEITSGGKAVSAFDANIRDIKNQIQKSEQDYQMALSKLNESKQVVEAPPPPVQPPAPPTPKVEPTPPWYTRLWNRLF